MDVLSTDGGGMMLNMMYRDVESSAEVTADPSLHMKPHGSPLHLDSPVSLFNSRVPTQPGKSWNLRKEFSRPGKSWKMTVIMESHGKVMEFHQ